MAINLLSESANPEKYTWTNVYTCPAGRQATVISAIAMTKLDTTMKLAKHDGSTSYPLTGDILVTTTASVNLLAAKLTLGAGESLQAKVGSGRVYQLAEPTAPITGTINKLMGNGTSTLVAQCSTGIWRSTDEGVTWAQVYSTAAVSRDVWAYIGTTWFIYTSETTSLKSTDDGLTWAAQAVTNAPTRSATKTGSIVKNGSTYAGLYSITVMSTSTDGITWTLKTAVAADCASICWTGTNYVLGRSSTSPSIYYSPDGVAWTTVASVTGLSTSIAQYGLISNGTGTVIAKGSSSGLAVSTDHGATWASITAAFVGTSSTSYGFIWTGTHFAIGESPSYTRVSPTGVGYTWVTRPLSANFSAPLPAKWAAIDSVSYIALSKDLAFSEFAGATVTASIMEVF